MSPFWISILTSTLQACVAENLTKLTKKQLLSIQKYLARAASAVEAALDGK